MLLSSLFVSKTFTKKFFTVFREHDILHKARVSCDCYEKLFTLCNANTGNNRWSQLYEDVCYAYIFDEAIPPSRDAGIITSLYFAHDL